MSIFIICNKSNKVPKVLKNGDKVKHLGHVTNAQICSGAPPIVRLGSTVHIFVFDLFLLWLGCESHVPFSGRHLSDLNALGEKLGYVFGLNRREHHAAFTLLPVGGRGDLFGGC